jgi:hypothetical protein
MTTDDNDDNDGKLYPFTPPPPPPPGRVRRKPRRSRITKTAAGLALILGAGAGAAAVASATTGGASTSPPGASASTNPAGTATTGPSTSPVPRQRRFGPGGPGGPGGFFGFGGAGGPGMGMGLGPNGAIHGTFTVKAPSGSYETIDTQYGTAESVSSSSITVKSADGFSQTYTVASSTVVDAAYNGILSVKVGDTISIQAVVNGSTVTAERVLDLTQVRANHPSWSPGPPNGKAGGPPPSPGNGPGGGGGSAA